MLKSGTLDQVAANQVAVNQQMWERVFAKQNPGWAPAASAMVAPSGIHTQKMIPDDDLEAFLNAFKWTAIMAR